MSPFEGFRTVSIRVETLEKVEELRKRSGARSIAAVIQELVDAEHAEVVSRG